MQWQSVLIFKDCQSKSVNFTFNFVAHDEGCGLREVDVMDWHRVASQLCDQHAEATCLQSI